MLYVSASRMLDVETSKEQVAALNTINEGKGSVEANVAVYVIGTPLQVGKGSQLNVSV